LAVQALDTVRRHDCDSGRCLRVYKCGEDIVWQRPSSYRGRSE